MLHSKRLQTLKENGRLVLSRGNKRGKHWYWVRVIEFWDQFRIESCGGHNLFVTSADGALSEAERIFNAEEYLSGESEGKNDGTIRYDPEQ